MDEDTNVDGRSAARAVAQWHLGSGQWADIIIDAYLAPEIAMRQLRIEQS